MKTPLVSIALLTYQHENYILDCIKGLLSQTYTNMELLIVDDASTDATLNIIDKNMQELEKKFVRVEVIRHTNNTGNIAQNFNELLKIANGEYIKTAAGDDALLPCCVETLTEYLEKNREYALAYSNAYVVSDTWHIDKNFKKTTLYGNTFEPPSFEDSFLALFESDYVAAPTIMIRSNIYKKYGYYDESKIYEDWDMLLRLARWERFGYINKVLVYYRMAQTSVSNNNTRKKFANSYNFRIRVLNTYLRFVNSEKRILIQKSVLDDYIKTAKQNKYYEYFIILIFRKYKLLIKNLLKNMNY